MGLKYSELRCKEVVNTADGCRLGYVRDLVIGERDGKIQSLILPAPGKLPGILNRAPELIIPWSAICRMGSDIILVDVEGRGKPRERADRLP